MYSDILTLTMTGDLDQLFSWAVAENGLVGQEELKKRISKGDRLRVKLGIDPTAATLHLGHALVLRKLRQFQDAGCQAVLVIGDFTAQIGDPAGLVRTRPVLDSEQIKKNLADYLEQAGKIIDLKRTEVVHNSKYLAAMNLADFLKIAMKVTVNNLIERDDFNQRLAANQALGLHELIYPLAQAYDSVEVKADVEIGGWDQRFNLLMGRELQKKFGQVAQAVILVEPLIGLDGNKKMSSSLDNYIALNDSAADIFGKAMTIPDALISDYARLAAWLSETEINQLNSLHPREAKALVAERIVALYHGPEAAGQARKNFDQTFKNRQIAAGLWQKYSVKSDHLSLRELISQLESVSLSQADRLISQRAVKINGHLATDSKLELDIDKELKVEIGKHGFFSVAKN